MEIRSRIDDDVVVLEISGRFSAEHAEAFRNSFFELFGTHRRFVFDLTGMDYLDSTGLGAMVFCLKTCDEYRGVLKLANLQDKPRVIFEITKAHRIFDIYDSVESAVAACKELMKL